MTDTNITKDQIRFGLRGQDALPLTRKEERLVEVKEPWFDDNKKFHLTKTVRQLVDVPLKDAEVIRVPGPNVDPKLLEELVRRTGSQAPVVSHDYFLYRSLSSIRKEVKVKVKDKEDLRATVFSTIYGGLYYQLSGVPKGNGEQTDLDALLELLTGTKTNAKKIFADRGSDRRVAMKKSRVTGRSRMIEYLPTLLVGEAQGLVAITHDTEEEDVDVGFDAVMNLDQFQAAAFEVIWVGQNGILRYALYNKDGVLQEEAPPQVVADTEIPPPHGTRLQAGISCIRCHQKGGGWQVAHNDVPALFKAGRLNYLRDATGKFSDLEYQKRVAALYSWSPEDKLFPRARDDFAQAILRTTGTWVEKDDLLDLKIVQTSTKQIVATYHRYKYTDIDALYALTDVGVKTTAKDAKDDFAKLLPTLPVLRDGIAEEDADVAALRAGIAISRHSWDRIYSTVARRIQDTKKNGPKFVP